LCEVPLATVTEAGAGRPQRQRSYIDYVALIDSIYLRQQRIFEEEPPVGDGVASMRCRDVHVS